ncbi:13145_t:CDS:2 [Funneliformis mosseae]|uniref:13145_t:CDS:1 n=1 Tax=Funneliformis mosseae TaxID=27381 RepID=A0A9N9CHD3_FUNMO|nr:13145_t:CDS:2 [Funneliformis mosseae]
MSSYACSPRGTTAFYLYLVVLLWASGKYVTSTCDKYWSMLIPIDKKTSDRIDTIYLEADYQTFRKNETRNGHQHMPSNYELYCKLSKLYDKDDETTVDTSSSNKIPNKDNFSKCAVNKYTIIRQLGQAVLAQFLKFETKKTMIFVF